MKKIWFVLFNFILIISSCQKSTSDFDPSQQPSQGMSPVLTSLSNRFSAVIDGKMLNFVVVSATLTRSTSTHEKRMDITAISTDQTRKIIITLGEETSQGNGLTSKTYILNAFLPDDPSTPNIDESQHTQGYTTYGITSNANWIIDLYNEQGTFTVTSCNASTTVISGVFETTLTDLANNIHVIKITDGKAANIKYKIIN